MTPSLRAPKWRWPLARLGLLTLAEAGLFVATAVALRAFVDAVGGQGESVAVGALLAACGAGSFAAGWLRNVAGEDLGMAYSNDLRDMLAAHAARPGRSRRLGTLAVRLTGDLNPMREWASQGISDAASGAAMALAGAVVLGSAAGFTGLAVVTAYIVVAIVYFAVVRRALIPVLRALRISRGRVASAAGDIVLGASAIARYDAIERERRRLAKRAVRLRADAVHRRKWAAALDAPGVLAASAVTALTLLSMSGGPPHASLVALLLFGAGLFGAGLRSSARALDAHAAFAVGSERMRAIARQIDEGDGTKSRHEQDVEDRSRFSFCAPGCERIGVDAGEVLLVQSDNPSDALKVVQAAGATDQSCLEGVALGRLSRRDLGRRVGLCAPSVPLLRASVRRNLSLRLSTARDEDLVAALRIAGLAPQRWPLPRRIDPSLHLPDEHTQALLRLARAIAHRPRVILVAEPVLQYAPGTPSLMQRIAEETGAAVVVASSASVDGVRRLQIDAAA